nr:hypothetical protein [Tanacetum cinerariifolium]
MHTHFSGLSDKSYNNGMLPMCSELRSTSNYVHWEPMFILYCQRDQFLKELDSLGVRHVPSKMAEFLREIQMRDKETVAKLQILVAEKELNARKKYEFIQNSRVSCRTEDVGKTVFMFCVWYAC